ncbi:MAG: hypothetical protein ABIJ09_02620 [Pseudomonadota bacterium]
MGIRRRSDVAATTIPAATTSQVTTPGTTGSSAVTDPTTNPTTTTGQADGMDRGSRAGSHVATDRSSTPPVEGGLNTLGLLSANRRGSDPGQPRIDAAIDGAVTQLRTFDANGDGIVTDRRWRGELDELRDPLARAVYDFANFGNYSGHTSLYGEATRGDVMSGGLGLGYTLRPEHYTSQGFLTGANLDAGVRELKLRLAGKGPTNDLPHQDLQRITDRAAQEGLLSNTGPERHGEIAAATERLLDHIQTQTESKERETGNSTATLTHDELFDGPHALPQGSLERLIADEVVRGQAEAGTNAEHWMDFFKDGINRTRLDERNDQKGHVGDMLQHYLLVVGKRAQETQYVDQARNAINASTD